MTRRTLAADPAAVSTVLGAILMFGLLVLTLVTVQVRFVPVWDQQRERDNALLVTGQIAALQSDLNRLAGNQTALSTSDAITLARPQGFTFLQGPSLPGTVTFAPSSGGAGFTLSSTRLTIEQTGGQQLFGLGETWTSVAGGQQLSNVAAIEHLRMRIVDPANAVGSMTLTLTDGGGNCNGKLVLTDTVQGGSDNNVEAQVYGPATPLGAACAATAISIEDWNEKKQLSPPYFYWDAFDANSQFPAVIAGAHYPLTLALSLSGIQGDYTAVYDVASGTGTVRVGGGGIVVPNYSSTSPVGTLQVKIPNQQLPPQTYTLEYGATILDQPDGAAMVAPPPFAAATTATQAALSVSVPALAGSSAAVTGARSTTIVSTHAGVRTFLLAVAPQLTIAIATAHPALWQSYWDTTMKAAGLSSANVTPAASCSSLVPSPQYTIATTASTATLTVFGPCPAPADTGDDISLTFQATAISQFLQPTS